MLVQREAGLAPVEEPLAVRECKDAHSLARGPCVAGYDGNGDLTAFPGRGSAPRDFQSCKSHAL
jgi:hypothetical protein